MIGFDASPSLIRDLETGIIDALVVQDPFGMGNLAVKTLVSKLRGKNPEKRMETGVTLVTRSNLEDPAVRKLLNPPIGEYLKETR